MNYWLRKFPSSVFANCFELRCEPKQLMLLNYKIFPCCSHIVTSPADNYLLADPSSAKSPNLPLIYITRYFSPSKKCLQFWYYMQGVGGRYLSVNVNQKDSVATEITRIVGDQGGKWKKATIPIESFLKTDGYLFNVCSLFIGII